MTIMLKSPTIKFKDLKEVRARSGATLADCDKALVEADGCVEKALDLLQKRGGEPAKPGRIAAEGRVGSHVHNGRIVAVVEVNCQTDFTARSSEFIDFVEAVVLHIAGMDPRYLSVDDAPEGTSADACLLEQRSLLHPMFTIEQLRAQLSAKTGEEVRVRRFVRWEMGDGIEKPVGIGFAEEVARLAGQ